MDSFRDESEKLSVSSYLDDSPKQRNSSPSVPLEKEEWKILNESFEEDGEFQTWRLLKNEYNFKTNTKNSMFKSWLWKLTCHERQLIFKKVDDNFQ